MLAPISYVQPLLVTLSIVKVKAVPLPGTQTLSELNVTVPWELVVPESLSVVAPLQWPYTVAPDTVLPWSSATLTWAVALVRSPNQLETRSISILATCIVGIGGLIVRVTGTVCGLLDAAGSVMVMVAL